MDFFKQIVDNLQIGVIISDHDGRIIYINDTYARFLDIDPGREVGKLATDVVANTRLHIVAQTGQMEINYPHQFKEHGFLVHRVPIKENDRVIAVVGWCCSTAPAPPAVWPKRCPSSNRRFISTRTSCCRCGRPATPWTASSGRARL